MAPLGDLAALHVALEVGARDVVEQQVALQFEEFAEVPQSLETDVFEPDLHLFIFGRIPRTWRIKERSRPELRPAVLLAWSEITEMRDNTLP